MTNKAPQLIYSPQEKGFSLIEMAVVLLILSILLGGILTSIGQSAGNARRIKTTNQIKVVQEALYGFAQTNGRLPCPATNNSDGKERFLATSTAEDGICETFYGLVPNVTLGLTGRINDSDRLLLDSWLNPLRYSVASYDTSADTSGNGIDEIAFTSRDGLKFIFGNPNLLAGNMLTVCDDPANCAATALADTVPAVVFSMGENWTTLSVASSAEERENSGSAVAPFLLGTYPITNTANFVSTQYSEDNFDDIISWLSPHILYTRLIQAGQLP